MAHGLSVLRFYLCLFLSLSARFQAVVTISYMYINVPVLTNYQLEVVLRMSLFCPCVFYSAVA